MVEEEDELSDEIEEFVEASDEVPITRSASDFFTFIEFLYMMLIMYIFIAGNR